MQDVWSEYERSLNEIDFLLEEQYEWCRFEAPIGSTDPSVKGVSFDSFVQVNLFHDNEVRSYSVHLDRAQSTLRQCWQLHGCGSSMLHSSCVLADAHELNVEIVLGAAGATRHVSGCGGDGEIPNDVNGCSQPVQEVWNALAGLSDGHRRVRRIQTWLLIEGQHEVCGFPRSVVIRPTMSFEDFENACRDRWDDLVVPQPISWHLVRGQSDLPHGGTHVVLMQNVVNMRQAHIVHHDAWPILNKHRAVMFADGSEVRDVMRKVQVRISSPHEDSRLVLSFQDGQTVQMLHSRDHVQIANAVVLFARMHVTPGREAVEADNSDASSDASTADTSNQHSDSEDDSFSFTMVSLTRAHFDTRGPYPWEENDLDDIPIDEDSEEPVPELVFMEADRFQMEHHVAFMRAHQTDAEQTWVAVTYGVGLTDLGRRDVEFRLQDLDRLRDMIQDLWHDHMPYGDSTLYFVTPQPEAQHVKPYLVFLVAIDYNSDFGADDRWILVRETVADTMTRGQRPYGVMVTSRTTSRAIMAQLGHHECFPLGARDCYVRMAGRWLAQDSYHDIRNGALCDVFVGQYPSHIEAAAESVIDAETLFKVARAHFENLEGSTLMTLRVHGVSPMNQPLGFRDVHIDYPDLANLEWISQVVQLWPFRPEFAKCVFVPRGDVQEDEDIYQPTMHLIVSYVVETDVVPILVRQRIHAIEGSGDVSEVWAVAVPEKAGESSLQTLLNRRPFWFHSEVRTHIQRDGSYVDAVSLDWSAGNILDLRVNVIRPEHQLGALWEMGLRTSSSYSDMGHMRHLEFEESSMIQLRSFSTEDEIQDSATGLIDVDSSRYPDAFEEICRACLIDVGQFPPDVEDADDAAACTEDKPDLSTAGGAKHRNVVQLSLEATLVAGPPELDVNAEMFQLFENDNWASLLRQPWPNPLAWLPEGMQVHATTWEALHVQQFHAFADANRVELYVDGATWHDRAAWAVAVVTRNGEGVMCQGVMSGCVCTDPAHETWIGARGVTNITAEVSALIVAQSYATTLPDQYEIVIKPDLRLSKQLADLHVSLRSEHILGGLSACISRIDSGRTVIEEVRAHCGQPWNELADGVAKQAAKTGSGVGQVHWEVVHALAGSKDDRQWAWLQQADPRLREAFPPVLDNTIIQLPGAVTEPVPTVCSVEQSQGEDTVEFQITSLNVLALDEKEAGSCGPRVLRLDQQMHERKCSVLCLQEARTQQGQRMTDHYFIYSSGGAGRNAKQFLGCEIWLHRFQAVASKPDGSKVKWSHFRICAVIADERRLALHLSGPMQILLVSLHAPCHSKGHSMSEVDAWWTETERLLSRYRSCLMMIGCDANAPLATISNRHHGLVGAEDSNLPGERFEQFLQSLDLAAPSTFECHTGDHGTWKHPRGKLLRRDYVLIPADLTHMVRISRVLPDVDLGFSHVDHYPVECQVKFQQVVTKGPGKIRWDRKKMIDPAVCSSFQEDLRALPIPRWDVDVDTHNQYFNANVRALAAKHFAADHKRVRNKPQLQESTLNIIAFKRQVLQCMRDVQGEWQGELKAHLKAIEKQLKPMIFRDQRQWYDDWVRELDLQHSQHNSAEVYRMLERLGRRRKAVSEGPRPLPLLKRPDGSFVETHQEMQALWCEMFAATEAGIKVAEQDLIDLHLAPDCMPAEIDLELLPGIQDIHQIVKGMRNGRVSGPNELLVETLKAGGESLIRHLLLILAKATLRAREPLEWKGGLLVPLFKGRGDPRAPSSFRSIFVSDCTAKVHHKWLRRSLEARWSQDQHSLQLGGRPGIGCDLAHHCVQAALAWCRSKTMSFSATFLDLKAAFYSVHRGAIFQGPWDDRMLCLAMERHGIMPDDWHEVRQQIESDCATKGISGHAEMVFRDLFHPTYFRMADVSSPVLTTRGSRPGDPVADIIFNMLFGIILKQSRQAFLQATEFQWIGQPQPADNLADLQPLPQRGLLDLAYVDDAVFVLYSPVASEILGATQLMASLLHDEARKRGLEVNYSAGKTEVMMKFAGKGSYALKQKLWHEMGGAIPVVTENSVQRMSVVHSYKHLGTVIQEHVAPVKEIAQRVTMARKAEGRIHRSFYAKRQVSLHTKQQVFQTTVCSRLMYNMHVLSWLGAKDVAKWEDGLRDVVGGLCRAKLGRVPAFRVVTRSLFALAGMLPPSDALHATRLKYCRKIIRTAPQCLWSMLLDTQSENSWIQSLLKSIKWLEKFGPKSCSNLPSEPLDALTFLAVDDRFHAKLTAARRSCFSYREQVAVATVKQIDLAISLQRCGLPSVDQVQVNEKWSCMLCDCRFGSKRGLAIHSMHAHGYKRRARFWVGCDECLMCRKKFFTRARAILHFQSSPRCLDVYTSCFAPMDPEQVDSLDAQEKGVTDALKSQGWWATKALMPICALPGPTLPLPDTEDAVIMRTKWEQRNGVNEHAFHNFAGICDEADGEVADSKDSCEILAYVGHSSGGTCDGSSGIFQQGGLAQVCAQVNLKCRLFLHVFSGYRRKGDIQDQLEALSVEGTQIFCVSLDICLARENADLLSPSVIRYWKQKMREGWVAGIGGAPPVKPSLQPDTMRGGPLPWDPTLSLGGCLHCRGVSGNKFLWERLWFSLCWIFFMKLPWGAWLALPSTLHFQCGQHGRNQGPFGCGIPFAISPNFHAAKLLHSTSACTDVKAKSLLQSSRSGFRSFVNGFCKEATWEDAIMPIVTLHWLAKR